MKKLFVTGAVCGALALALLGSCENSFIISLIGSGAIPTVRFFDSAGDTSRSAAGRSAVSSRAALAAAAAYSVDSSMNPIVDYYSTTNLGELRGKFTPTEFRLFLDNINIHGKNKIYRISEVTSVPEGVDEAYRDDHFYADFAKKVILRPGMAVATGKYDGFYFDVMMSLLGGVSYERLEENKFGEILATWIVKPWMKVEFDDATVDITAITAFSVGDGTTSIYWGDIGPTTTETVQKVYTGEAGRHVLETIPDILVSGPRFDARGYYANQPYGIIRGLRFVSFQGSSYRAFGLDDEFWDIRKSETLGLTKVLSDMQWDQNLGAAIVIPLPGGFTIPTTAKNLRFEVGFDLTDLVEVYDNNTSADQSDDIIILAKNFWERFSFEVLYD
jgi:hypothetical protein